MDAILRKMKSLLGINTYKYDAFLSHAVEDKIRFANDLEAALVKRGMKLWYSGKELGAGDRIDDVVRQGLLQSRYGIVILSPTYFTKIWTLTEFAALFIRETNGRPILLPVLVDMNYEDVLKFIPVSKNYCVSASAGVDAVADKLLDQIGKLNRIQETEDRKLLFTRVAFIGVAILAIAFFLFVWLRTNGIKPDDRSISQAINDRIALVTDLAEKTLSMAIITEEASPSIDIKSAFAGFTRLDSRKRNFYNLETGIAGYDSKKRVNEKLRVDLEVDMTPLTSFQMDSCDVHLQETKDAAGHHILSALYVNLRPVKFTTSDTMSGEGNHQVLVTYTNNVRLVEVRMQYPLSKNDFRIYRASIIGLPPSEAISFHVKGNHWEAEHHP